MELSSVTASSTINLYGLDLRLRIAVAISSGVLFTGSGAGAGASASDMMGQSRIEEIYNKDNKKGENR
eukprot:m.50678 g.50678  ORF g.50678 m.50678 type:complete len:68 (+) comp21329_c0_seq1:2559-2762(+)